MVEQITIAAYLHTWPKFVGLMLMRKRSRKQADASPSPSPSNNKKTRNAKIKKKSPVRVKVRLVRHVENVCRVPAWGYFGFRKK